MFYNLFLIIGLIVAVVMSTMTQFRNAILAFLAIGTTLVIIITDNVVDGNSFGSNLSAAGFVLLGAIFCYWILFIGSERESFSSIKIVKTSTTTAPLPR